MATTAAHETGRANPLVLAFRDGSRRIQGGKPLSRLLTFAIALATLVMASTTIAMAPVLAQDAAAPSPIPAGASVVAQGVAAIPENDLAWRISRATAPPTGNIPAKATPGFLLADQGELLLNNRKAESQLRLGPGEAAFAPVGSRIDEVSLADPLAYFRIDLVAPADAANAGNDEIVFVGEPFASPGGNRDIDLARDVLAPGETLDLALNAPVAPVLFLVTSGVVGLVPASNPSAEPVELPAGQAAALRGGVIATAGGDGATVAMAFIGPEVPAIRAQAATPTPTPEPETANLTLQVLACPAGYTGDQYSADCVEPVADIPFTISSAETGFSANGATGPDGAAAFTDLEPGSYAITGSVPETYSTPVITCGADTGSLSATGSEGETAGATVALDAGMNATCTWYAVPKSERGENEGTVSLAVLLCSAAADQSANCTPGDATGVLISGPATLATDTSNTVPATIDGGGITWGATGGLPFGTYTLQPGGIAVPEGYQLAEVRGAAGDPSTGWSFTVDAENPEASLQLIYVQAAQQQPTAAPNGDTGGDGLTDVAEAQLGTDPTLVDTDGDGIADGQEVAAGTDPLDPNSGPTAPTAAAPTAAAPSAIDADGDNLTDAAEAQLGTDPHNPDTDGDGLSDFDEVGFDPASATGTSPTTWDTDGDGVGDGDEIANGTDPTDPTSH
jgi:hypothetical protein